MRTEREPDEVPREAKQSGEARPGWEWVEPGVWTERMLDALITGVKGDKWFSLIDKVYSRTSLRRGYERVAANRGSAGVDHVSLQAFGRKLEEEIEKLHAELKGKRYHPQTIKRVYIPKAGSREKRPLGIPTVRDRVVQASLRQVIEPIFEQTFRSESHGFRPGRGCKDALREVDRALKEGSLYVVDIDLRKFFDTINHQKLMGRVEERIADGRVLGLIGSFLKQGVLERGRETVNEEGTPQGGVISPLLANIYLNPLDHTMGGAGYKLVRYADDMVVLCESREEAEQALDRIREWTGGNDLELHGEKTRIVDMNEAGSYFDFLGYRFKRTKGKGRLGRWPSPKSQKALRDRLAPCLRRANGRSLEAIIKYLNPRLKGWYAYFKHGGSEGMQEVDGWVRMRLRSILRKRQGKKGRGRGLDHHCWPNIYFATQGLFSLSAAQRLEVQSACR